MHKILRRHPVALKRIAEQLEAEESPLGIIMLLNQAACEIGQATQNLFTYMGKRERPNDLDVLKQEVADLKRTLKYEREENLELKEQLRKRD